MFNFTVNMSELTDEDIYARMEKANAAIMKAYNAGGSTGAIEQIRNIIASYQFELADRAARQSFELNRKYLEAVIETDPSMAEPKESEEVEVKPRRRVSF